MSTRSMMEGTILHWHKQRNLIDGTTDEAQLVKLAEELSELMDAVRINSLEDKKDAIGDMAVVLINIAERNGFSLHEAMSHAYNEIKDRTGRMVDGIYVKDVK